MRSLCLTTCTVNWEIVTSEKIMKTPFHGLLASYLNLARLRLAFKSMISLFLILTKAATVYLQQARKMKYLLNTTQGENKNNAIIPQFTVCRWSFIIMMV